MSTSLKSNFAPYSMVKAVLARAGEHLEWTGAMEKGIL